MINSEQSKKQIKVSVVTAVLNGEQFIRETIESVLGQEGDFELEYIIKDGESTDDTLNIIEEYSSQLRLISMKDKSPQDAINQSFEAATGDILCWLNADDTFEKGTLNKVVKAFQRNPSKSWLYGRCSIMDNEGRQIQKFVTAYKNVLGFSFNRNFLLCENFINQPATFWRRELWGKCMPLSENYKAAWDYELWLKMSLYGSPIVIRSYLAKFRRHPGSISETQFATQFKEELNIGQNYGKSWHNIVHNLNRLKTVAIYTLMHRYKSSK